MWYRRARRNALPAGTRVYVPESLVVKGWWVEPGTPADVLAVPAAGDLTIRLAGGEYSGEVIAVGIDRIALDATTVTTAAADGWDGKLVEIRPGIGVELLAAHSDAYTDFVARQLARIAETRAGRRLLDTFDPENRANAYPPGRPLAVAPYSGRFTVLINQPRPFTRPRIGQPIYPVIKTADVGRRTGDTTRVTTADRIPLIYFFDRPAAGAVPHQIGSASGADAVLFTHDGVTGHRDFPGSVQDFDTVLFHELVHAYLSNTGIADRLRQARVSQVIRDGDQAEEELVVGIWAGLGLPLSENAYRVQTGRALRTSYLENRIPVSPVGERDWDREISLAEAVDRWQAAKGLSAADAHWVLTGQG